MGRRHLHARQRGGRGPGDGGPSIGVTAPTEIDLRSVGADGQSGSQQRHGPAAVGHRLGHAVGGDRRRLLLGAAAGSSTVSTLVNDVAIFSARGDGRERLLPGRQRRHVVGAVAGSILHRRGPGSRPGSTSRSWPASTSASTRRSPPSETTSGCWAVGGSIVQSATGIISGSTLSAFAAGTVDLALANNDVDFFTATGTAGNVYFLDIDDLPDRGDPGGALADDRRQRQRLGGARHRAPRRRQPEPRDRGSPPPATSTSSPRPVRSPRPRGRPDDGQPLGRGRDPDQPGELPTTTSTSSPPRPAPATSPASMSTGVADPERVDTGPEFRTRSTRIAPPAPAGPPTSL